LYDSVRYYAFIEEAIDRSVDVNSPVILPAINSGISIYKYQGFFSILAEYRYNLTDIEGVEYQSENIGLSSKPYLEMTPLNLDEGYRIQRNNLLKLMGKPPKKFHLKREKLIFIERHL
jgi:hypothetical protein